MTAFLTALLPSAGVLLIFWIGIRALIEADRRERSAQARIEAEQARGKSRPAPSAPSGPASTPPEEQAGPGA